MYIACLEIQKKVLEKLQNDATLASYVKDFSIGEEDVSRTIWPYVSVSDVNLRVGPLTIGAGGSAMFYYDIVIQAGTRHTLPEIAFAGDDSGKKGIVQLVDDAVTAVFPDNLDGLFNPTLRLEQAGAEEEPGSAGTAWRGTIRLSGYRSVPKPQH